MCQAYSNTSWCNIIMHYNYRTAPLFSSNGVVPGNYMTVKTVCRRAVSED
jgi:hypothetical protein